MTFYYTTLQAIAKNGTRSLITNIHDEFPPINIARSNRENSTDQYFIIFFCVITEEQYN